MPERHCRCRNFTIDFTVVEEDSERLLKVSSGFADLCVDEQAHASIGELYPEDLQMTAEEEPLCVRVDSTSLVLRNKYDGMQAAGHKLVEGLVSTDIIYCANCRCPLVVKSGGNKYVVANVLCLSDEIPRTWPLRTDKPECIKYSKKFDILYYDGEACDDDEESGTLSSKTKAFSIEINASSFTNFFNSGQIARTIGSNPGSFITSMPTVGSDNYSKVTSVVMKSMKHIVDGYASLLRRDVKRRCEALAKKLDKDRDDKLEGTEEAIESIIRNVRVNSYVVESPEVYPLYNEISSSSSSLQQPTPVLSGAATAEEGYVSLTPESFNTIDKPHGLPGRTAATEARRKILEMESFVKNKVDLAQRGVE